MRFAWQEKREVVLNVTLLALLVFQGIISFHWLWLAPAGDEAIHIYNAFRVASGHWPYRDFFSYLTPGTYLFGGTIIAFLSEKIAVLRLAMTVMALAGILLVYLIVRRNVKNTWQGIIFMFVYVAATTLTATYFSHHNLDNFLFLALLWAILCVSYDRRYFVLIGAIIALDSLVHQAHGFYYFLATVVFTVFLSGEPRRVVIENLVRLVAPIVILYLPFVIFLLVSSSFDEFIEGVILWNVKSYATNLAFGPFEDTLYLLHEGINVVEQPFFFLTKVLVLLGGGVAFLTAFRKLSDSVPVKAGRLMALVLAAFVLGHLQTMHNAVAYYALAVLSLGFYLLYQRAWWMSLILVSCTAIQLVRVASFPIRYHADYLHLQDRVMEVTGNRFYRGPAVDRLLEAGKLVEKLELHRAVVVGRSPELYYLFGIDNPTGFDVILPVYLTTSQINQVISHLNDNPIIYDRTSEKLRDTRDFFDVHHYKKTPEASAMFENSPLYSAMNNRQKVYESDEFVVYR